MEEKLRKLATIDSLTDVFNRRHFIKRSLEEMMIAKRYTDLSIEKIFRLYLYFKNK